VTVATAMAASTDAGARAGAACAHCGLPVPRGLIEPGAQSQFCCAACRTVYRAIHECGLERYYALREAVRGERAPAASTGGRFGAFDADEFLDAHARPIADGTREIELYLAGVHCPACVWLVERLPRIRPGVVSARLDLSRSIVRLVWDQREAPLSAIARDLDRLGYPPHPARGAGRRARRASEDRAFLIRVAVAGAIAGNSMLVAAALYSGRPGAIEAPIESLLRWVSAGLGLLAILWPGRVFFRGAIASARAGAWSLDLPIALGLALGGAAGAVNVARGSGEIYFDSLAVLVFLLLAGRFVQRAQQRRATERVERLYALTPASVTLVEAGAPREAPIETVRPGSVVRVAPGATVPVDGVVAHGRAHLDTAVVTGESRPVAVEPGDRVGAGAVVVDAPIDVRAEAVGEATRLGRILRDIERAAGAGSRVATLVDRFSRWFVLGVVSLALVTLGVWLAIEPASAPAHAIALLIVTCPCALGLATPMAVTVAMGRASRAGVFLKSGDALEALAAPGLLLLDKTGTLTKGSPRVLEWIGDESLRAVAAALEAGSRHPIARAIIDADPDAGGAVTPQRVEHRPGLGVVGVIEGAEARVGAPAFVTGAADAPAWAARAVERALDAGQTPVCVALGGRVGAVAVIGDRVREDAATALRTLRARGWRVGIVSGDDPRVVERVAGGLGGPFEMLVGGATPERKREIVEAELARGPVAFAGDGVNDAPALVAATVGVAVHGGAEASLAAADVYLTRPGVAPIVGLVEGAARSMGVVRRNMAAALAYNAVAATLAVAGLITPLVGAVLMPVSSLTVLGLSLRARTFETVEPR